jgi:hypothetical protein
MGRRWLPLALLALLLALPWSNDADSASGRLCAARGICHKVSHACTQQVNTDIISAGTTSYTVKPGVTLLSKVAAIAAGGGAANGGNGGYGGGGGAYAEVDNLAVTPGNTLALSIGTAGAGGPASTGGLSGSAGGDTSVSYLGSQILLAQGGQPGTAGVPGNGGAAASGVGTVKHSGGSGGNGGDGGGGGGGAGGPSADGITGSDGQPGGGVGPPFPGGDGGAGDGGAGGAGGTGSTQNNVDGSPGGAGHEFGTAGSGGGGGGGVGGNPQQSNPGRSGKYGAGGGGPGFGGGTFIAGADGSPGVVAVQFTFCGNVAPPPPPQNTFFVATNGTDSNDGLTASPGTPPHGPFLTLGQCQVAMRASSTVKTCTFRAGTYTISGTQSFTGADSGETLQFFSADGVNTAVFDGGSSVNLLISTNGTNNFTVNGLKFQHCSHECVGLNNGSNITMKNSEVAFTVGNDGGAAADSGISAFGIQNSRIANNYLHDMSVGCITLAAFDPGSSINGSTIANNVCLNSVQAQSDAAAIYTSMRATGTSGGTVTIVNNLIRDWGNTGSTNDQVGIYLDDNESNTTVSGNIIGPPLSGAITDTNRNNTGAFLDNGGTFNTITNNIIDLGSSSRVAIYGGGGNSGNAAPGMPSANVTAFTKNIVISNFTGALNTSASGVTGFAFYQGGPASSYTFGGDIYANYAGGGAVFTNGQVKSDPSPINPTTTALALTCPGGVYTLAGGSTAFNSPTNFVPIAGGWGPPGFVIPTSPNHSCA